jgi:ABC-2 type transport system permease protein
MAATDFPGHAAYHLNDAMRSVAFEGHNLWDVKGEIGILLLWTVGVYFVATKVFKWE